jgi:uncharacterized damage-inducible protein DinB
MIDKLLWIERRFAFDLPLSMFPNVLERLRGTPARIEERVHGRNATILQRRLTQTWSIQENIGHLVEVEGLWLGRLDDFAAGLTHLRPADMSNARTDAADYNSRKLGEVLARFREVRGQFVHRLETLDESQIGRSAHHPRLDRPMRIIDLMVFAAEHDDHHLARISELPRALE